METGVETPGRLVVGLQPVRECLRAHGKKVERVVALRDGGPRLEALLRFARDSGIATVELLSRGELDRLAGGVQHQGVIAWGPALSCVPWASLAKDPKLLGVALDRIQDPQNFGAVVRSAVGIAGAAIVWGEHASAPLTPTTFRASAGAIEHAVLCRVSSLTGTLNEAQAQGIQVVALAAQADVELRQLDLTVPTLLVIGSEGEGLQRSVRKACTHAARIVRPGRIDSLNASAAAAVALYECERQRSTATGSPPSVGAADIDESSEEP